MIPGAPPSWMRDQQLALAWTPFRHRAALSAFFLADATFGHIALSTTDPMIARIKLAWWREQGIESDKLDHPLSSEVNRSLKSIPDYEEFLRTSVDAWDRLIVDWPPDASQINAYATGRGKALAGVLQSVSGSGSSAAASVLARWAAVHLAKHSGTPEVRELASGFAEGQSNLVSLKHMPAHVRVLSRLSCLKKHAHMPDVLTAARGAIIDFIL